MQKSITFGAVGDVAFHRAIGEAMLRQGIDWPFARVRDVLGRADLLFGNMESVVLPPGYPANEVDPDGLISPLSGDQAAQALRDAGFDFMNMAANHVLDAGTVGMFHTQQCLREAGIATAGVGLTQLEARQLSVLERNGIRFGFLCYCEDNNYSLSTRGPCHAYYDVDTVVEDVQKFTSSVDVLVVSIHADIEFMETPSVPRRDNSRRIADAGAKIVLEHHPHAPQGIEMHNGCLIAYSLGNFVFNSHTSSYMKNNGPHTAHSFVLLAKVTAEGVESFERVPIVIGEPPEERPRAATGAAADALSAYFAYLDQVLQDDDAVRRNWQETARQFVLKYVTSAAQAGSVDDVIYDLLSRLLFVAENRAVMDQVYQMAQERWTAFVAGSNTYHRPYFRLRHK
jgi:hypothetical protein